jgi:hypothetical protein
VVIVSWEGDWGLGLNVWSPILPQGILGEVGGHRELGGGLGTT